MPKVSICIPAYNQTKYLTKTLDSLLAQTYSDYEIIITDDSPGEAVKEFVARYDFKGRLIYHHNEVALGSPANWNFCISLASGDYIKILHHDDWFTSGDSLAYFVRVLEESDAAMAFSNAAVLYEKSKKTGFYAPEAKNILRLQNNPSALFLGNFIGAPSVTIYKRDDQVRFDEYLKWLDDVDFYIKFLEKHKTYIYIDQPLIGILADSEETMTAGCNNNKEVELYENFYLFEKLKKRSGFLQTLKFLNHLWHLMQRFNIPATGDIKQSGYFGRLPLYFRIYFTVRKLSNKAMHNFKRLLRSLVVPKSGNEV